MKNVALLILFSFIWGSAIAQKSTQFFIKADISGGFPLENLLYESSVYTGVQATRLAYFPGIEFENITPLVYGAGIQAGLSKNNRWYLSTGVRYSRRRDEGIYYCHVCDLYITHSSVLDLESIEIPVSIRYNLNRQAKVFPFLAGDVYWSQLLESESFDFWAYRIGGGLGLRTQKKVEFLLKVQYNHDLSDRMTFPNLVFRDLIFAVEGVFKFSSKE